MVVALVEHPPADPEGAMHRARDPRADGHHPSPELLRSPGLDQEVHVVALEREVHDPERALLCGSSERPLHFTYDPAVSEGRQAAANAERHMAGFV